jgi:polyisoprenoid-binding protein YceI
VPGSRTGPDPVETICSGAADGFWLLDPVASRVQFTIKQFWGLFALRGGFDYCEGCIDICQLGSIAGTLAVSANSVSTATLWGDHHLRSTGLWATANDPMIVFQTQSVLLMVPDQAWVAGTLMLAKQSLSVAFESRLRMDPRLRELSVEAKMRTEEIGFATTWAPRLRWAGPALLSLRLVFVKQ